MKVGDLVKSKAPFEKGSGVVIEIAVDRFGTDSILREIKVFWFDNVCGPTWAMLGALDVISEA